MSRVYTHGKRLLSLILALALLPCANLGLVVQAQAADSAASITDAALVAENYELTEQEKALLNSGCLASEAHSYVSPTDADELISVDADNNTVKLLNYTDSEGNAWVPAEAGLYVGETLQESLTLADGSGCKSAVYTYEGNAFSVRAAYVLNVDVSAEKQEALLAAIAGLKNGVDNLDAAAAQDGLSILENDTAKSQMMKLLNGEYVSDMKFGTDAAGAVTALYGQYDENSGSFALTAAIASYKNSAKTQYLLKDGDDFYTLLKDTYEDVLAIKNDGVWDKIKSTYDTIYNGDGSLTTMGQLLSNANPSYLDSIKQAKTAKDALLASLDAWVKGVEPLVDTTADWSAAGNTALVSGGVSYAALDEKVEALDKLTEITSFDTVLKAAEATVRYNMSMFNVNVTVKLMVAGEAKDALVLSNTCEKTVTLSAGETKDNIRGEVEQLIADAAEEWTAYKAEHYAAPVYSAELPETLTEDIDLTVTYSPKQYTVTYTGDDYSGREEFYYGYVLTLPVHSNSAMAYDYDVIVKYDTVSDRQSYAQGATYKITSNVTISRTAGKAYNTTTFYKAVADSCGLSEKETTILTSGALKGDATMNVRYPDAKNGLVTISGKTLTAQTYASGYQGLDWKPYSYQLDDGDAQLFGDTATATLNGTYSSVTVLYRLELTNFETSEVKAAADLPDTLVKEAAAQKNAFKTLNGASGAMSQINGGLLAGLTGMIDGDETMDGEIKTVFKAAVASIKNDHMDGNSLKLCTILANYADQGLTYYYQNSESVRKEISELGDLMDDLMDTEEKKEAIRGLLSSLGSSYASYADKIESVQTTLATVEAQLTAPNAAIDTESDKLAALVNALDSEGDTTTHAAQTAYLTSTPIVVAAPNKTVVTVVLSVEGKDDTTVSATFDKGDQIDVAALKTSVKNALDTLLGENTAYYTTTYSDTALDELAGEADDDVKRTYTWTMKRYTVKIEGAADQSVTIGDLTVTLPTATESGKRYEYTIGEQSGLKGGSYTFTKNQLTQLFVDDAYTVTRKVIDVNAETLDQFVEDINGTGAIKAELNKARDTLTVTIDLNGNGLSADLTKFVKGLALGQYDHIGLNGEAFISTDNGMTVSLQTLIDALEMDNVSIQQLIGADGTINVTLLIEALQLGQADAAQGAKLRARAASVSQEELEMKLVLTGKLSESLSALRGTDWGSFELKDGTMSVHLNLPEKVYEVYLAAQLLTGTDLDDINTLNSKIAYAFLYDLCKPAVGEGVSATTYQNTLDKLGIKGTAANSYLNTYKTYVDQALTYLSGIQLSEDGSGYELTLTAKADQINEALGKFIKDQALLGQMKNMIKECQDGESVKIKLAADVQINGNTKFQALVIDRGALNEEGISKKADVVDFTNALASRLTKVKAACAVILLDDVDGDLTFNTSTYLDLRGHTITGNVTAADGTTLTVIDSSLATNSGAGITGKLNGSFAILGGTYTADVTAFLKDGYEQDTTGLVFNKLYTIKKSGNSLTFNVNADLMEGGTKLNTQLMKTLALDICADVLLNNYSAAMLSVDGGVVYDLADFDVVALWSDPNVKETLIDKLVDVIGEQGLADFANKLISGLTDFEALADAIDKDESLLSFKMTTAPWQVKLTHETNGDYIDVKLGSNKAEKKTVSIDVKLAGKDENKAKLQEQLANLAVVKVDAGIDDNNGRTTLNVGYDKAEKEVTLAGKAHADITVALSDDPNYAVVMGVIVAYTADDAGLSSALKTEFVDALQSYYNGNGLTALKTAFDKLTVNDLFKALSKLHYAADTIPAMFNKVGLDAFSTTGPAKELGEKYAYLLDKLGWAVDIALDALGKPNAGSGYGMAGLAANAQTYGDYLANKEDLTYKVTRPLSGYYFTFDVAVSDVSVRLELFRDSTTPNAAVTQKPATNDLTYSGREQTLITAGAANGGEMQYKLGANGAYGTALPKAKDAGTYTVYYKAVGNKIDYLDSTEGSVEVTIAPKTLTADDLEFTAGSTFTKTYDGDTDCTTVTVQVKESAKLSADDVLPTVSGSAKYDSAHVADASKVIFTTTESISANYKLPAGLTIEHRAQIEKADSRVATAPTAVTGLNYNSTDKTLIVAGVANGGTMQYAVGENGTYSDQLPKGTDAGTYNVYYKVVGDADHKDTVAAGPVSVTIAKVDLPESGYPTGLSGYKGSKLSTVKLPTGWSWKSGDTELSDVGDKTFAANYAGNTNYNAKTDVMLKVEVKTVPGGGGGGGGGVMTYAITVESAEHGTVTASHKSAYSDSTVTITVTPDAGYTLDTLTVLDKKGKEVKVTAKDGKYTFTMPASNVTVKASFISFFVDVPENEFYYDAVLWAVKNNVTTGVDATHFAPGLGCSRAEIVTFLWRVAGCPEPTTLNSFSDVPADSYYAKAVAWAVEKGITKGISETEFAPDLICTRSQAVTFLYRRAGSPAVSGGTTFVDVAEGLWYTDAVAWAVEHGVTLGVGASHFAPDQTCTRAQIVTFLYRCENQQ